MRITVLLLAAMAALTSAYTKPNYERPPMGNIITKPNLDDVVTVNKPYTIEWQATTKGPISIVLLRGPSKDVHPLTTVVESINNTGHYDWIPDRDLEPDTTHYGLMIVVEGTGEYQYSTQFGIDNPHYKPHSRPTTLSTSYSTYEVTRTICPNCYYATPSVATNFGAMAVVVETTASAASDEPSGTAASSSSAGFTGAASRNTVGLGAVAAAAMAVLAL